MHEYVLMIIPKISITSYKSAFLIFYICCTISIFTNTLKMLYFISYEP